MKYIVLVSLNFLFITVYGQASTTCEITDYVPKSEFGQSIASDILWHNLDSLTKDFKKEKTFSLKFYCFIKPDFEDSVLSLNTDTIYIFGENSIDAKGWEADFKENLKLIIKELQPHILIDSLMKSNCETLIFQSTVRRCR